jgi:hypothetical protein
MARKGKDGEALAGPIVRGAAATMYRLRENDVSRMFARRHAHATRPPGET